MRFGSVFWQFGWNIELWQSPNGSLRVFLRSDVCILLKWPDKYLMENLTTFLPKSSFWSYIKKTLRLHFCFSCCLRSSSMIYLFTLISIIKNSVLSQCKTEHSHLNNFRHTTTKGWATKEQVQINMFQCHCLCTYTHRNNILAWF